MNAAAKRYEKSTIFYGSLGKLTIARDVLGFMIVLSIVIASAISIVYLKNYERHLISLLQNSFQTQQRLIVEWNQLLLEESTWSTPSRIQQVAQGQYDMLVPPSESVITVKL